MDVNQLLSKVESKPKKSIDRKLNDESFDNVMNSISKNWDNSSNKELESLKKELLEARNKIKELEVNKSSLTKNEEKIIAAIRSESIEQKTESPIISYNRFRRVYKVSSNYYRPSISSLIEKKIINKEETSFSGSVKTFKWKLIEKIK